MKINYAHLDPVAYALLQRLCAACDAIERPLSNVGGCLTVSGDDTRRDLARAAALALELRAVIERVADREEPKFLNSPYRYMVRQQPEIAEPTRSAVRQAEQAIQSAAGCLV